MAFILSKIKFFHRKVRPEQDVQLIIDVEEYLPEELAIDDIDSSDDRSLGQAEINHHD